MSDFFRSAADGVELFVRLTPRGGVDALEGIEETADGRAHLKARVRAAPEKGAANRALEGLLAAALGLPRKQVTVSAGATSRLKTLRITGDSEDLGRVMETLRNAR